MTNVGPFQAVASANVEEDESKDDIFKTVEIE
jgi:hypothetical protein